MTAIVITRGREILTTDLLFQLDAKKSPLALLAQTCSQIGADPPSSKSLLASLEKTSNGKSKPSEQREKSSPATTLTIPEPAKSSFKPYESCLGREKASSPEEHRSGSNHSSSGGSRARTPGGKRCSSNQSASSARAGTPQGRKTTTPTSRESPVSRTTTAISSSSDALTTSSPSLQTKPAYSPVGVLAMTDPAIKDLPLGTFKPGVPTTSSSAAAAAAAAAYLGYPSLPMDMMTSSLVSQHHAALKNGLAANPYLSYTRMKTPGGAEALVPVCRDPYCTGCQLNSHLLSANGKVPTSTASSCPAGCAQCDHKPGTYPNLGVHSPNSAFAHAQLAALAAMSQMPYVCSWIAGDTAYCGKRFATSEELLQHLRSHTSVSIVDPSTAAALSLLSPPGLPPHHPLLSRTYPTPPLSPLATARYHPYGKPMGLGPSLSSLGLPLHPPPPHHAAGLPPYFSPYSLYAGPRLGAASGMHP